MRHLAPPAPYCAFPRHLRPHAPPAPPCATLRHLRHRCLSKCMRLPAPPVGPCATCTTLRHLAPPAPSAPSPVPFLRDAARPAPAPHLFLLLCVCHLHLLRQLHYMWHIDDLGREQSIQNIDNTNYRINIYIIYVLVCIYVRWI